MESITKIESREIKELLINLFELDYTVKEISDEMPIVQEGLELDSVDILEVIAEVEKNFNVKLPPEELGKDTFKNIGVFTQYLNTKRHL